VNQDRLTEIRNNLYRLPAMEDRLRKLRARLAEAEQDRKSLLVRYEAEAMDVQKLQDESLSAALLRLFGRYEGKLDKETQEMVQAKVNLDKAAERVKELQKERDDLSIRISELREEERFYDAELARREEELKSSTPGGKSVQYQQLEEELAGLYRQLVEIDEAISAASKAKQTAMQVVEHLKSADSWATYDVWFKGGIISHAAKYGHIDDAEAEYNRLSSNLKDLRSELKDINMSIAPGFDGIDSTTRAVDFWFDNIFTDLNVRNRIRGDMEQASELAGMIQQVINRLESSKAAAKRQIESIESQKKDLLISGE
jgi:chromosome segregation ATPase